MNDMRLQALEIAVSAHKDQRDKGGHPYILHPIWVANKMSTVAEQTVALLHDLIEDTDWMICELIRIGFDNQIIAAVDAITKRHGETREQYFDRVKANPIALKVKIADLVHNSDVTRLETITARDITRRNNYQHDIGYLLDMPKFKKNGLWYWCYGPFEIHQNTTNNPDGSHGPAISYIAMQGNNIMTIKNTLGEAVWALDRYSNFHDIEVLI